MNLMSLKEEQRTGNSGLAKVAVQCPADTIVGKQTVVLRINICVKKPRPSQICKPLAEMLRNVL